VLRPPLGRKVWDTLSSRLPAICESTGPGKGGTVRGTRSRTERQTGISGVVHISTATARAFCGGGGAHTGLDGAYGRPVLASRPQPSTVVATPSSSRPMSLLDRHSQTCAYRRLLLPFNSTTAPVRGPHPHLDSCDSWWGGVRARAKTRLEVRSVGSVVFFGCASSSPPPPPPNRHARGHV